MLTRANGGSRASLVAATAVAALALLGAGSVLATAAQKRAPAERKGAERKMDFGDAPDGRRDGRAGLAKGIGRYPSLRRSDGARHAIVDRIWLGRVAGEERDSRQVDRDDGDDGFAPSLRSCKRSEFRFVVNASGLSKRQLRRGRAYLNAWLDWTRDGDWRDRGRCNSGKKKGGAAEWAVRNHPVNLRRFVDDPVQTIVVRGMAGPVGRKLLWHRASVTLERFQPRIEVGAGASKRRAKKGQRSLRVPNDGRGSFKFGETEDGVHLLRRTPPKRGASCRMGFEGLGSDTVEVTHGAVVPIRLAVPGGAPTGSSLHPASSIPNPQSYELTQLGPGEWRLTVKEDPPDGVELVILVFSVKKGGGPPSLTGCLIEADHVVEPIVIADPPLPEVAPPGGEEPPGGGGPPGGGAKPECSDGVDNDADGEVDGSTDLGCYSAPGAKYDPADESEEDVVTQVPCDEDKVIDEEMPIAPGETLERIAAIAGPEVEVVGVDQTGFPNGEQQELPCGGALFDALWEVHDVSATTPAMTVRWFLDSEGSGAGSRQVVLNANTR